MPTLRFLGRPVPFALHLAALFVLLTLALTAGTGCNHADRGEGRPSSNTEA